MATLSTSEQEIIVKQEHSVSKDQEMATLSTSEQEITVKQEHSVSIDQEMATLSTSEQEITVKQEHSVSKDQEMAILSTSEQEITVKQEHSVSKDQEMATLSTSEQEITVKQEHSVSKDQEMATLSTSEQGITVKQEHLDEKAREMMTLQSDTQENPCGLDHFLDPMLSPLFLTGPFGRLVVVDEFTTNYQKILTTTASSNKIILARQFGRMPSNILGMSMVSLAFRPSFIHKPVFAQLGLLTDFNSLMSTAALNNILMAKCKYWSHKVVHPSMISPADSLEELVHQLAEQMGWKPSQVDTTSHLQTLVIAIWPALVATSSKEVGKSSRTSTGLSTFPRSFREWGEVLIETYKHIESWEDLTFSPDFSSEDKTVLARIALESGLLCRRVKTSNFLLLVVSKQFFLSKVIKSLITFPELNNKYQLLPPEIIPQLEMKDELDKAMNSPEDENQTLCDPTKTKQMKDPLNCRVIESLTKTCDEKPVALSSNLVGVDKKHSLLRTKLRTNLSSKGTSSNRPSFLKDPHLARVLPNGDYGQMVLLDSCDLGAVIEDVIRSLSESCIDYKFVHEKPTANRSKRKEKEFGSNLNTCKILIGGKTVTIGQHKKMKGATVIAAKKLMTKLKLQHFFVKGPRPRFLPVPFIPDEKAFVIYAEKLLQEYSREETSSALVVKTDLGTKKEKILGRIAKRLDLKMFHSQPNIHSLVITKLTNFWTLVKLLASGDRNANYKLIAPPL
uniref:Uncharacterized protein n=1 Tax=Timema monikensis TaxID=170555 RepID=A0A7R9DZB7_9NEOP|nr:unnamed protein product [Timema monikensis]